MDPVTTDILEHCRTSPRREVCGVVSSAGAVYPIRNVAASPNDFTFSKRDYYTALSAMKAKGESLSAIYHSHVNGNPELTPADKETMERFECDFILVTGGVVRRFTYE